MPEIGGSYFTFSNENNDLIWGFLAECHRRGWLYKGHDTMPWCPRCGTGLSQMEMNEGYQDREDPGLTVRFPLVDRPGESLLVWTTTPWTLTSNVAAAVGPSLRYVRVRQGDDQFWVGKGTLQDGARGRLRGARGGLRRRAGRLALRRSVRRPARGQDGLRGRDARRSRPPYEHVVVSWSEVGEDEGTGIVHIAPGCGAEDFQLGKALGLPVIAPDRRGRASSSTGSASLSGRDVRDVDRPDHRAPQARGALLPPRDHHPPLPALLAMRHAARLPPRRRVVHQHGPALRPAARDADEGAGRRQPALPDHGGRRPDPLDPRLRLRARARLAPQHARLDDQQEALLGAGAADLRLLGVRDGRGHRRPRRAQGARRRGLGRVRGPHPAPALRRRGQDRLSRAAARRSSGSRDVGNPWLDAGIVPFSTLHYREDPEYWAQWFPADFITESFPGQFRNWFYSMLAMSTVLRREPPFKDDLRLRPVFARGRPPDAQELGQRDRVRRGGRPDGRRRHALDVRQGPARGQHPVRLARGGRGAPRAAGPVERLLVLRDLRPAGRLEPDRGGAAARRAAGPRPLDPVAGGRHGGRGRGAACAKRMRSGASRALSAFLDGLSTWYLRLSRRRFSRSDDPRDQDAAFATLHEALVATARMLAPILPFLAESLYGNLVTTVVAGRPRQRPPDALADGRAGSAPRRGAGALDGGRPGRRGPRPDAAQQRRPQDPPTAGDGLDRRARPRPGDRRRTAAAHRRRDQRQGGRPHRRRVRPSSSAGSSRSCPRSGSGSGRRSPR